MTEVLERAAAQAAAILPSHLAQAGFILVPEKDRVAALAAERQALPAGGALLLGTVPNPASFSEGPDLKGAMFTVKSGEQQQSFFPASYAPFAAVLQDMINEEYAHNRHAQKYAFSVRASRHTAQAGEPHQSHVPGWHSHPELGDARIQTVADRLGTGFRLAGREVAAPDGARALFDKATEHITPRAATATRRTFVLFVAMEDRVADRYLRDQSNRNPAEILLCAQPYGSYDSPALYARWAGNGAALVAAQRQESLRRPATKLEFQPLHLKR